jgi:hypothetical protein
MIVVCADSAPKVQIQARPRYFPSVCYEDLKSSRRPFSILVRQVYSRYQSIHSNAPILILLKNPPFILEMGS